jgi:hypothetical protein
MTRHRTFILAVAVALAALSASAVAATYTVYTNDFSTRSKVRALHLVKMSGQSNNCSRGWSSERLRVAIGAGTTECNYTPSIRAADGGEGGNFAVNVSSVISKAVKKSVRTELFSSVAVRLTDQNSKYRLDVYSAQHRFALRHYSLGEFASEVPGSRLLASGQRNFIGRPGSWNRLRIRIQQIPHDAGNPGDDEARLTAKINGKLVASVLLDESSAHILEGPRTSITLGRSQKGSSASGAVALFDNLSIQATL